MGGPGSRWRLLVDGEAPGPWNMGVDEALFASAAGGDAGACAATLRLYRWQGPWLSLGYGQRLSEARAAACREAGVGVVRRVTGGLAVLHGADLTYALAAPAARLPAGLHGSYGLVADALGEAFARLGVALERSPACDGAAPRHGFDCFAEPAPDELLAGGRKIAGSAQRRAAGAVLQHGSIRLAPDPPAAAAAAGVDPSRATSLTELGAAPGLAAVVQAVVEGFERVLGVSLEPGSLSPGERRAARERGALPAPRPPAAW
jgi:lipoate-protein ligase A